MVQTNGVLVVPLRLCLICQFRKVNSKTWTVKCRAVYACEYGHEGTNDRSTSRQKYCSSEAAIFLCIRKEHTGWPKKYASTTNHH